MIGVPDEKWGETVKALVVLRPGRATVTEAELIEFCRERMSHYKCPTSIEFRDELARTATGKLQKFKLRQPYWEGRDRQALASTGRPRAPNGGQRWSMATLIAPLVVLGRRAR